MNVDIGGVSVYIGIPVYGRIPPATALSLAHTLHLCGARAVSVELAMMQRGIVTWARDMVIDGFLKSDKMKLFWIDSDMVWAPDDFFKMLALSTFRDVVCAAYQAKKDGLPDYQIYGTGEAQKADELGLLEVMGTGLGFTIMDRAICEQMVEGAPVVIDQNAGEPMRSVFRTDVVDGVRRGEDIAFFSDIRALGHKVWLDPAIRLGHIGERCWQGRAIDSMEKA